MTQEIFDARAQLAFTFAKDLSVQLITLSTGIITFTLVFAKDVLKNLETGMRRMLALAWTGLLFSVLAGIMAIMGLTGDLVTREHPASAAKGQAPPSARAAEPGLQTKTAARIQIILFAAATGLVIRIFFRGTPQSAESQRGAAPPLP